MAVSTPTTSPVIFERAAELAAIDDRLKAALRSDGRVVVIGGDAGTGKTRLTTVAEEMARARGFGCLRGVCAERDGDIPFAGVIDMLRPIGPGVMPDDGADRSSWWGWTAPPLEAGLNDKPASGGSPTLARRRQLESILRLLERLANEQPRLVVLEDVHWADPSTLDVIEAMPRRLQGARMLVLVTARTDEPVSAWRPCLLALRRSRLVAEVGVEPLSATGVAGLLAVLIDGPVPPAVAARVFARSGGNPLYVEELAATAVLDDAGDDPGAFGADETVPPTLAELVRHRLDGLPDETRTLAILAAVAGGPCSFDLLVAASGQSQAAVARSVRTLVDRFIMVEPRDSSGDRVAFRHALTRDAIYDRLIGPERRMLHGAVAAALLATADANDAAIAADLGRHFHAARNWRQTLPHATRAGDAAVTAHATAESLVHHLRALAAAVALDQPERATLHRRCGRAYELLGAFEHAREHAKAALALARTLGDRATEIDALDDLASLHASRDYRAAELLAREALRLATEHDDAARRGRALNRLGNIVTNLGRYGDGRRLHEEALRRLLEIGDTRGAANSVDLMAMASYLAGDVPEARGAFGDAAERFAALDDVEGVASARTSRGLYLAVIDGPCATDVPPEAYRQDAAVGLALCEEIEWRSGEIYALVALACAALGDGAFGRAGAHAVAAYQRALEVGHEQWTVIASFVLGLRLAELGDEAGAIERLTQGLTIATSLGSGQWCERLQAWIAQCHVRLGDFDAARAMLRPVAPPEGEAPGSIGQRRAVMAEAELELLVGQPGAAAGLISLILDGPAGPRPAEAMLLRGRILAAAGHFADADAALLEARRIGDAVGPRPVLWRVAAARSRLWSEADPRRAAVEADRTRDELSRLAATISLEAERVSFRAAPAVRRWLVPAGRRRTADSTAPDGLTPRERTVARAVAGGLANKEIAHELGIAVKTVEMHVGSCLGKLGFASRAQLAVWAVGEGILAPTKWGDE